MRKVSGYFSGMQVSRQEIHTHCTWQSSILSSQVKGYRKSILEKFDSDSITEAINYAMIYRLIG